MTEEERRAAIIAEAYDWLRTPYIHLASVKHAGVDCAMLMVEVYREPRGPVPLDYDPRPYSPEWYLHQSEERYIMNIEGFGRRIDPGRSEACGHPHVSIWAHRISRRHSCQR
jgi:hypothetical protein